MWRIAGVGVVVAGALTFVITMAGTAAAMTPSARPLRSAPAALVVGSGPSTGAAGSRAAEFEFTNHSAKSCFLHGYPRVQMLSKSGKELPTAEQKDPGAFGIQDRTVVLAPGKTAYFGVVYASQTGYGNLTCPRSNSLRFSPPQSAGTLTLTGSAAQIAPYGGTTQRLDCGIVHVTAVTALRFQ